MPHPTEPQKPTMPTRDLPRGPASKIRPSIAIGTFERPGGTIEFDCAAEVVEATIIAVWNDGVTLRRNDTRTVQFLHRGNYRVLPE